MKTDRLVHRRSRTSSSRLAGPHFERSRSSWRQALPVVRAHALPRWLVARSLPHGVRTVPIEERMRNYPEPLPWREEVVNALLHGMGAIVGLVAGIALVNAALDKGEAWLAAGCAVYTATLVATLGCSFGSHLIHQPHWRHVLRVLDQACIYLLTAGSCTPFFLRYLMTDAWWWMLPTIWAVSILGFRSKLLGSRINGISVVTYIALGWFPMLALPIWLEQFPLMCWVLVGTGGLAYTTGTWFLMNDHKRPFFHAIWHLFVLVGLASVHTAMFWYVVGV